MSPPASACAQACLCCCPDDPRRAVSLLPLLVLSIGRCDAGFVLVLGKGVALHLAEQPLGRIGVRLIPRVVVGVNPAMHEFLLARPGGAPSASLPRHNLRDNPLLKRNSPKLDESALRPALLVKRNFPDKKEIVLRQRESRGCRAEARLPSTRSTCNRDRQGQRRSDIPEYDTPREYREDCLDRRSRTV